jgi:hypothetical protein
MLRVLVIASTMALALPGCGLFVDAPPTVTTQGAGCSSLLPGEWKQGVDGAEMPSLVGSVVGDWIAFADAQTGRLDTANDRTVSAIGIVERCEARDAAAVRRATRRKFLGIL